MAGPGAGCRWGDGGPGRRARWQSRGRRRGEGHGAACRGPGACQERHELDGGAVAEPVVDNLSGPVRSSARRSRNSGRSRGVAGWRVSSTRSCFAAATSCRRIAEVGRRGGARGFRGSAVSLVHLATRRTNSGGHRDGHCKWGGVHTRRVWPGFRTVRRGSRDDGDALRDPSRLTPRGASGQEVGRRGSEGANRKRIYGGEDPGDDSGAASGDLSRPSASPRNATSGAALKQVAEGAQFALIPRRDRTRKTPPRGARDIAGGPDVEVSELLVRIASRSSPRRTSPSPTLWRPHS